MKSRTANKKLVILCTLTALAFAACSLKSGAQVASPPSTVRSSDTMSKSLFSGATLAGWHPAGSSKWTIDSGSIVGSSQEKDGGWLFLDAGYQDFVLDLSFQCDTCNAGVLLRATKTAEGMSGIYIPIGGSKMGAMYRVKLDKENVIVSSTQMPGAPPPGPIGNIAEGPCAEIVCAGIRNAHGGALSGGNAAAAAPQMALTAGWNAVEITMRGDVIFATINGNRLAAAQMDDAPLYGQIGLQVSGSSTVKFKDADIYNLNERAAVLPEHYTASNFKKIALTDNFYAEGVAVGDINRDGHMDVVSGPFYYTGPDFKVAHEIYPPATADVGGPQNGLPEEPGIPGMGKLPAADVPALPQAGAIVHGNYTNNFLEWVYDFNGDGWPDVLVVMGFGARPTFSAHLFINPKGENRDWDNYEVAPIIVDEMDSFVDIDGDGKPELIIRTGKNPNWSDAQVGILRPDWSDVTKPWKFTPVSTPGVWGGHGSGVGDINGDGRIDIVNSEGWWEQPPAGTTGLWKYHKQRFGIQADRCGPGCGGGEIGVYDVNGDGLADVVTGLSAHGPGLAWFEQMRDAQGNITWKTHTIMGAPTVPMSERGSWEETDKTVAFTELHAEAYADMTGNGLKDIITGKRWWSHGFRYEENEQDDPPVVYWFELQRKPDHTVQWVPHLIDNASGVGVQMVAADVTGDGRPDVITAARKGLFVFQNNLPKK
jgi:Domain of Unknown Function (DUF1080)/FG-GAP-like repeat